MNVTDTHKRNWMKIGLGVLGIIVMVLVVFGAGFWTGRVTALPFGPLPQFARDSRAGHGATGIIKEISEQKIVVQLRNGKTQILLITAETRFDKGWQKISASDLKINDQIIAIGSPNSDGEIVARLIGVMDPMVRPPRVFPAPPNR